MPGLEIYYRTPRQMIRKYQWFENFRDAQKWIKQNHKEYTLLSGSGDAMRYWSELTIS